MIVAGPQLVVAIAATILFSDAAMGTSPLLDTDLPVSSPSGKIVAAPGPKERTTVVARKVGPKTLEKLWEMPEWNHVSFVSDDGEYLVRGYWGVNILETGHAPDEVMLSFYRRGMVIKKVRLNEMVNDPKYLRSDYRASWGYYQGFVELHKFIVDTMEQRRLVYDATTGNLIDVIVPSPNPTVAPSTATAHPSSPVHRVPRKRPR